jgi:hypothetical protein
MITTMSGPTRLWETGRLQKRVEQDETITLDALVQASGPSYSTPRLSL